MKDINGMDFLVEDEHVDDSLLNICLSLSQSFLVLKILLSDVFPHSHHVIEEVVRPIDLSDIEVEDLNWFDFNNENHIQ